jgi:hypothetical protein
MWVGASGREGVNITSNIMAAWMTPRIGGILFRIAAIPSLNSFSSAMSQGKSWTCTPASVKSLTSRFASKLLAPEGVMKIRYLAPWDAM